MNYPTTNRFAEDIKLRSRLAIAKRRAEIRMFCCRIGPAMAPEEDNHKIYLEDAIMKYACPTETFDMSFRRLARAAGELGFYRLTPFAVWRTYRFYNKVLSQPMRKRKKEENDKKR